MASAFLDWEIWASDDGSQDDTHAILERYQGTWGAHRMSIHYGPAEGFVSNFLSLTCKADIQADCYAYSDQDDIWEEDKLQRAVDWLRTVPAGCLRCTARVPGWSTRKTATLACRPCFPGRPALPMP